MSPVPARQDRRRFEQPLRFTCPSQVGVVQEPGLEEQKLRQANGALLFAYLVKRRVDDGQSIESKIQFNV